MPKKSKKPKKQQPKPTQGNNLPTLSERQLQSHSATSEVRRLVSELHLESFKGPLPKPSILKEYDEIVPGFAERIVQMAENQAIHRQSLEKIVVTGDSKRADRGLYCGVAVTIAGIIAGVLLGIFGQPVLAGIFGGVPLVGLAGVFVYGTERRKSERSRKTSEMAKALQAAEED